MSQKELEQKVILQTRKQFCGSFAVHVWFITNSFILVLLF